MMCGLAYFLPLSAKVFMFYVAFMASSPAASGQPTDELCMFSPSVALRNTALAVNSTDEATGNNNSSTVKVEIYFESLCPYCHALLLKSLKPMWENEELRPFLDLRLFPAGNVLTIPTASVSDGYRFWHPELEAEGADEYVLVCQHGERECLGNAIHSCAMQLLAGPSEYLPLIFCMAESAGNGNLVEKASFECMHALGINATEIAECVRAPSTNVMMFDIANYSSHLTPKHTYTPWVVVDGVHSKVAESGDLLGPVCAALGQAAPSACTAGEGAEGLSGIWGSVRRWLGVAQTSSQVIDVRADGTSHAPGASPRGRSDVLRA